MSAQSSQIISARRHHYAFAEIGGASTQIAFVPEEVPLSGHFPLHIVGANNDVVDYDLYVHSYLQYGQNMLYDNIENIYSRVW